MRKIFFLLFCVMTGLNSLGYVGTDIEVTLNKTSYSCLGETVCLSYAARNGYALFYYPSESLVSRSSWIDSNPTKDGKKFYFTIEPNRSLSSRSGTVELYYTIQQIRSDGSGDTPCRKSCYVTVIQDGVSIQLKGTTNFGCKGGSAKLSVVLRAGNTTGKASWSLSTDSSWVSISETSGTSSKDVYLTVSPNDDLAAREATISVDGTDTSITIHQSGWTRQWYAITYLNLKGAANENLEYYPEGTSLTFLPLSNVSGYTFDKWTPQGISTNTTGNVVATANWIANDYTIHFDSNGGVGNISDIECKYDQAIVLPTGELENIGYNLMGWSLDGTSNVVYGCGTVASNLTSVADGDVTLYAVWEEIPVAYEFKYEVIDDEHISITGINATEGTVELLRIPETINGKKVVSISNYAFFLNKTIKSVRIPSSIDSIGQYAFYGCPALCNITMVEGVRDLDWGAFGQCPSLTSIAFPNSVTNVNYALIGCTNLVSLTIPGCLSLCHIFGYDDCTNVVSVIFREGTTNICDHACYGCSSLREVSMPESVIEIGEQAFQDCISLKEVALPSRLQMIDSWAFSGCNQLTAIEIPGSVAAIGSDAFEKCSGLSSLIICDGVSNIRGGAFENCKNLASLTIPHSVTNIGGSAFHGCSSVTSLTTSLSFNMETVFGSCRTNLEYAIICNGVVSLCDYAFSGCSSLKSIVLPASLKSVGRYAFYECGKLDLTLPDNVSSIGEYAFGRCNAINSFVVPLGVDFLDWCVFGGCKGLMSVTIHSAVTNINGAAFSGCYAIQDVSISGAYEMRRVFPDAYTNIVSIKVNTGDTEISAYAFYNCFALKSVSIPDSVTKIGERAFYECRALETVSLPVGLTQLEASTFACCSNLTSVAMPGMKVLGAAAFECCTNLRDVRFPDGIESINLCAFARCQELTAIEIPYGVTNIGFRAFYECNNVTTVRIPSSVQYIGSEAFACGDQLAKVFLPTKMPKAHQKAFPKMDTLKFCIEVNDLANWCETGSCTDFVQYNKNLHLYFEGNEIKRLSIPEGVRRINDFAFGFFRELCSVEMPSSVCEIGVVAFSTCTSLDNINLSAGITNIADSAFWGCASLRKLVIPASVTSIGPSAFYGSGLTNIVFQGDAPICNNTTFNGLDENCVVNNFNDSTGWIFDDNGLWNGLCVHSLERLPHLESNATDYDVKVALSGVRDQALLENITNVSTYAAFRMWADGVKDPKKQDAEGVRQIASSQNAWLSFALGSEKLIEQAPTNGQMRVERFEPTSSAGSFEFTVGIDDIAVGSDASKENLKKVFGIEGGTSPDNLSSANVDISFGTPENGKVKFTAGPNSDNAGATSFFMKVKMTP